MTFHSDLHFLSFFNVYLFLRETECKQGRGRERGRHRIWSRFQALSCQHRAWYGARTHEPWDHGSSRTLNRLSHPGAPYYPTLNFFFFSVYSFFGSGATDFSSGHDLAVREFQPHVRLCADSSEPGACFRFCVSLSLFPSPTHALSLCVCISLSVSLSLPIMNKH